MEYKSPKVECINLTDIGTFERNGHEFSEYQPC